MNNNQSDGNKRKAAIWWKGLRRSTRIILSSILSIVLISGVVALAVTMLSGHAHDGTELSKEHFLTVSLTGSHAEGSIKPGGSITLSPTLENTGDVDAAAFIKVTMPTIPDTDEGAYSFVAGSGWNLVIENEGVQIWSYGTGDALEALSPDSFTEALTETGFTMKSSITGVQFSAMDSVDIEFDAYLADYSIVGELDPESAWNEVPEDE